VKLMLIAALVAISEPVLAAEQAQPAGVSVLKITPVESSEVSAKKELAQVQKDIEQLDTQIKGDYQNGMVYRQMFGKNSPQAYTASAHATALKMQREQLVARRSQLLEETEQ
jgi:hypothetical protein